MKNPPHFAILVVTSLFCQCWTVADLSAGSEDLSLKVTQVQLLPRFTEVREAAVLFFVKKHVPEMSPFLAELKRTSLPRYQMEIRYIFQVTELLADIRENRRRHNLELKIWIAQNKAQVLVAQLATPNSSNRETLMDRLTKVAKQMVQLDIEVLQLKQTELEEKLKNVKRRLDRTREDPNRFVQQKINRLLRPVPTQSKSHEQFDEELSGSNSTGKRREFDEDLSESNSTGKRNL
ncbi:MAG: hypothetical protein ACFCD0_00365 [Gemmataceae bacterium]